MPYKPANSTHDGYSSCGGKIEAAVAAVMPIRLRARPLAARDLSPVSVRAAVDLLDIDDDDSFRQLASKLSVCAPPLTWPRHSR